MNVRERTVALLRRTVMTRMALGVVFISLLLTAAFVGLLGFIDGASLDVSSRLPAYALVMGVVFVIAILRLDTPDRDGATVLVATAGIAMLAFALVTLATEGVFYTVSNSEEVLNTMLILYFAAAGLVCTGVVIWALHHWREFAATDTGL